MLSCLLTREFQLRAENEKIFNAIIPVGKNCDINNHLNDIPHVICNSQNAGLSGVLQYFVTWELFHYLNGVCDFNPQRLEAKIRWYLERNPVTQK